MDSSEPGNDHGATQSVGLWRVFVGRSHCRYRVATMPSLVAGTRHTSGEDDPRSLAIIWRLVGTTLSTWTTEMVDRHAYLLDIWLPSRSISSLAVGEYQSHSTTAFIDWVQAGSTLWIDHS